MRKGIKRPKINCNRLILQVALFFLAFGSHGYGFSQSKVDHYVSISFSRVRPLSMGGAFTAAEGGIETIHFNPAALRLFGFQPGIQFAVFINPVAPAALYHDYTRSDSGCLSSDQWWNVIRLLFKGVVISSSRFDLGVVWYEELLDRYQHLNSLLFFDTNRFFDYHMGTGFIHIKLADQVALGGTITQYSVLVGDKVDRSLGASYGIFLKPNPRMDVGVVFIDLPQKSPSSRIVLERFEDETVNVGISYKLFRSNLLTLDIRNISEENKTAVREVHIGLEQRLWRHLAVRGGFFKKKWSPDRFYSLGIGLVNLNLFRSFARQFDYPQFLCNYGMVVRWNKVDNKGKEYWHMVSLLLSL